MNIVLTAAKVTSHLRIYLLNYNEKGNLSGIIALMSTSSMLLPQHQELALKAASHVDQNIIDAKRDQIWHKFRAHVVDLERYEHEGSLELMQEEIRHGSKNIELAWTPRWLLSAATMAKKIEKGEKSTACVKFTITS